MTGLKQTQSRLKKLKALWARGESLLIVMQNNPDAIAASCALRELANKTAGLNCQFAYGGTIGRAENRELAHYLGFAFHPFAEVSHQKADLIALIDTQPQAGNNPLPEGVQPDIIIDHHPAIEASRGVAFADIRENYGATSTILWEYLTAAEIKPETPTATALLYGIRSDTQDLGREATKADIKAIEALYPLANKRMLSQIQQGQVPSVYYQMLATALANTKLYDHCLICGIGDLDNPDMIGEVADLLLRHEQVDWAMCYGFYDDQLLISLRTQDYALSAGDVARNIVQKLGTGGGHARMAGGQIPLRANERSTPKCARLERAIRSRFLKSIGIKTRKGRPLIRIPRKNGSIS
ncbi:MAG: bifunctional oligoribonuclease/PAP phosphatase NrnA [Sedimentisphaerales bacterium]|nr:bifunctional oligoribonuclease/PAP phosphatase NrnA [Sedimentisphaerales bacterium]